MSFRPQNLAGRFVVIDGPDGAGKSTQCRLLADRLGGQGLQIHQVRDPGGTAIGDRVRGILLDVAHAEMSMRTELMLYMASRAQLVEQIVRPALSAGACVLSDRYVSSTIAYQGAGGADPQDVLAVANVATGGLWPDLTILLDLPAEAGLGRVQRALDRMEAKGLDFHRRVRQRFASLGKIYPGAVVVVDAAGSVEQVHQAIWQALSASASDWTKAAHA